MTINRWRLYAELAAVMGLAALLSLSILTSPASRHKGTSGVAAFHPSYPGELQMPTWATLNGVPDHQATEDVALLAGPPPPPTNPCGSYTVTYNSYIYDTDDSTWPWYGANGNYTGDPITENQTPSGHAGYGDGPYQNFDICDVTSSQVLIYSTALGTWVGEVPSFGYADSPGSSYEYWDYSCAAGSTTRIWNSYYGDDMLRGAFATGLEGFADGGGAQGDAYLIKGLCGD